MKKGQVALIVLIVSAVIMTVGMSLSRKTVIDTKIDTDTELAKSAFDAAESGIDYYVRTGNEVYEPDDDGVARKADVSVTDLETGAQYTFETPTQNGKAEYFWLVDHDNDDEIGTDYFNGDFEICVDSGFEGSVKVDYFYKVGAEYQVERFGYNFNWDDKIPGFTNISGVCGGEITGLPEESILLVLTPLYDNAIFTLKTAITFPAQGKDIVSTGKTGNLEVVPISRSIRMIDRYKVPAFLLEAITAEGDVSSE